MANDRWYNPGDHYQLDDLSGFKIRASISRKIPGGQTGSLIVDPKRWEAQHPQDFVRGIVDEIWVPDARPRQTNQFMVVGTWVTAFSQRLTNVITVDSTVGFQVGHIVSVMMDYGESYRPVVIAISGNTMTLTPVLPRAVGGNFADPLENVVLDLGPSGLSLLATDAAILLGDDLGNVFSVN